MKRYLKHAVFVTTLGGGAALGAGIGAGVVTQYEKPVEVLHAQNPVPTADNLTTAFRQASKAAMPGVVFVQVETKAGAKQGIPEQYRGTPYEDFFRRQAPQGPRRGSGSGFVIREDGYILTNNHVVADASRITVVFTNKREYDAVLVGRDPNTDIAVLKVSEKNLPTVKLGNSNGLQVGDWVLALGYPMSLGETVTAGIVSAKGKQIGIMQPSEDRPAPVEHFIQTDAAINPGNSGGPLINLQGEVVGINTAIASPTGNYAGYGFAVPVNLARKVADDIVRYGTVHRPKLGVQIKDVSSADAEVFGLKDSYGSVVTSMMEGAAQRAGVEVGDVIVAIQGVPTKDTGALLEEIAMRNPGDDITVDVVRYGKNKRFKVRLDAMAQAKALVTKSMVAPVTASIGFQVTPMTQELAARMRMTPKAPLVVMDVTEKSYVPAEMVGLQIETINGVRITDISALEKVAAALRKGDVVSVVGWTPIGNKTIVNYRIPR